MNNYGPRIVTDGLVLCLDAADRNSFPGSGTTWKDLNNSYNANLVNSKSSSANISSNSSNDLYIGNNSSANDAWHGNISQVSIYNKALNNSEIRQNFEATKGRFGL